MDRVILHCDCNNYFASVESIDRPELRDVAMAVCGDPKSRHGIILAKNEHAKKFGIVTAETIQSALKKCPSLVLVPPHHDKYELYCKKVNDIYVQYTDQVEAFSIDESWLDVTGSTHIYGSGLEIANTLRKRMREELDLTISVGVSFNKTYAKLGSDYKKPDATTAITRENYKDILFPLPARHMMFVGASAAKRLSDYGINTIGDIVSAGSETLSRLLGKAGESIWHAAAGLDSSVVKKFNESDPIKSISNAITFPRNLTNAEDIKVALLLLADTVGTRLRKHGFYATVVQVQIKDPEFKLISRQRKLYSPIQATRALFDTAMDIMLKEWKTGAPIRLLALSAEGLTTKRDTQLSLLNDTQNQERQIKLDTAVDTIRERYGKNAVEYGALLNTDLKRRRDDSSLHEKDTKN